MTTPRPVCFPDPVPDQDNLFDRSAALSDVLESVRHRSTVIRGGRLIGKTSLLNVIALALEDQGQFAMIRLPPADSRVAFMAEILGSVQQWVEAHQRDLQRGSAGTLGRVRGRGRRLRSPRPAGSPQVQQDLPVATIAQLCQRIASLADEATGVVFLLCVDEFDSLIQNWDEHEAHLLLELIAHLDAMPAVPVRFLLTLSTIPDLMLTSFRSPILNQAKIVTLGPWHAADSASFADWLADGRLVFDEQAAAALYQAAGGHPYFTKAVISSLLAAAEALGARDVSQAQVATAVRAVVRSPEVDFSLRNLTGAHLSATAIAVLDRAASSQSGVTSRGVGALHPAGHVLDRLQADGLLRQQGDRYFLRLGLWRDWRAATASSEPEQPLLRRISRTALRVTIRRVSLRRAISCALASFIAGPLLAVLLATAYLAQHRTELQRPCEGQDAGLAVDLTYPAYASAGDTQQIRVRVMNTGQTALIGSVLVSFPAGGAQPPSPNSINIDQLRPGADSSLTVDFTTTRAAGWLPWSGRYVNASLTVGPGASCRALRLPIGVAPVPRLQQIQKVAGTVLLVFAAPFLVPIVAEVVTRRLLREGRGPRAGAGARLDG